ncbi:MAG: carbohydrate ABC transporter permease, partial [Clostridia bacterium]
VTLGNVVITVLLTLFMLMILLPFINAIMISFITQEEYLANKLTLIPKAPTLNAYEKIFREDWLLPAYSSSLIITALGWAYCLS